MAHPFSGGQARALSGLKLKLRFPKDNSSSEGREATRNRLFNWVSRFLFKSALDRA